MKKISLKNALVITPFLAFIGQANVAFGHQISGASLGVATAIDYYLVFCHDDGSDITDHFDAAVKGVSTAGTPIISIQVSKNNAIFNATDSVNGDAIYSPWARVKGGSGDYLMAVNKIGSASVAYEVQFYCYTVNNRVLSADYIYIINQ
ncbi:hypothetical protein [Methylovulum psychrotolerans]|uniref:Uncharacterized protein n=1 Tax=Methylovulum psychrotolerans TaxID=1704499 RepID=A0A1Z4BY15_9GAMM|nr:hypothetical protein [Methylovulum psychrotolerans]ASF46175.1 hypothetical protein CEK71_08820 [Methylovulum psychrotolerans]